MRYTIDEFPQQNLLVDEAWLGVGGRLQACAEFARRGGQGAVSCERGAMQDKVPDGSSDRFVWEPRNDKPKQCGSYISELMSYISEFVSYSGASQAQ